MHRNITARAGETTSFLSIMAAYLSLVSIGLMGAIPFLQPFHALPLTSFYGEWVAIALGLGACIAMLTRDFWESFAIPKIVLPILGLIGLIVIQKFVQEHVYTTQTLLPALYLAWTALLAIMAAWLRRQFGTEKILAVLAWFILAGGIFQAFAGIMQYLGLHDWLGAAITPKQSLSIFGNLGQRNHFATYIMLALLALIYLFAQRRLPWAITIPVLLLFTFVLTLSSSRAVAIYVLSVFVLSLLAYRKTREAAQLRLAHVSSLLLMLYLAAQISVPFLNEWLRTALAGFGFDVPPLEALTAIERGALSGIEDRLVEARKAWLMFLQAPILGVGIGQYGWHSFLLHLLPEFSAYPRWEIFTHAHNLFLQVLAELGAIGLLLILVMLFGWLRQFLGNWMTPANWLIAACLLVLFVHSNLEYPLWYSYFLGVIAVFLGLGDTRMLRVEFTPALGRFATASVLFFSTAILAITFIGYRHISEVNALILESGPSQAAATLQAISKNPLLTPWAEAIMATHGHPDERMIGQQVALTGRVMRHHPNAIKVNRHAVYLAEAGRTEEALELFRRSALAYAPHLPDFVCSLEANRSEKARPLIIEARKHLRQQPACEV